MYFDGNGDYLSINQSETLNLQGDFTLECWFNMRSEHNRTNSDSNPIIASWPNSSTGTNDVWQLLRVSSGNTVVSDWGKKIVFNASGSIAVQSTSKIELNTWNHVAIVGHGDDLSMFINGKLEASTTGWQSYTVTNFHRITVAWRDLLHSGVHQMQSDMYLQDFRISTKAVYTGCFVPPASLHTNLVTTPNEPSCDEVTLNIQSDTTNEADAITDISVNSHAITKVGDAKHSSTETILGASSLYFDGNGDYLSLPASDDWNIGTADFTIEFWVNFDTISQGSSSGHGHGASIIGNATNGDDLVHEGWFFLVNHSGLLSFIYEDGSGVTN